MRTKRDLLLADALALLGECKEWIEMRYHLTLGRYELLKKLEEFDKRAAYETTED